MARPTASFPACTDAWVWHASSNYHDVANKWAESTKCFSCSGEIPGHVISPCYYSKDCLISSWSHLLIHLYSSCHGNNHMTSQKPGTLKAPTLYHYLTGPAVLLRLLLSIVIFASLLMSHVSKRSQMWLFSRFLESLMLWQLGNCGKQNENSHHFFFLL